MAYLNGMTVAITGDNVIDAMTNGYKWNLGSSRTIDWSTSGGTNGEYWVDPSVIYGIMKEALDSIEQYVNVTFNFAGHFDNPVQARISGSDINIASDFYNEHIPPGYAAVGNFPRPNDIDRGDIYFDGPQWNALPSFEPGSDGFTLIIHEMCHTMGLKHPHDSGGTGRPTFAQLNWGNLDVDFFTVMSYNDDDFDLNAYDPATPMILDVLALQYLYGKSTTTHAGNTTWRFARDDKYNTIYDASGRDTIDQSRASEGWVIQLPNLKLTDLVNTRVGIVISQADNRMATPTDFSWLAGNFENAIGSAYDDTIAGNLLKNLIKGGNGDDLLTGGGNRDRIFGGRDDDILKGGSGRDVLVGGGGEDRFVFSTNWDVDRVRDFDAVGSFHDTLDLRGLRSVTSWSDLRNNHMYRDGSDVVIDGRNGDRVILEDVSLGSLDKGDFLF